MAVETPEGRLKKAEADDKARKESFAKRTWSVNEKRINEIPHRFWKLDEKAIDAAVKTGAMIPGIVINEG